MNRDSSSLWYRILGEFEKVEKSISLLEDVSVFNYVYSLVSGRLFTGQVEVADKSSYLKGVYDAMEELSKLPDQVKEVERMRTETTDDMLIE